MNMLEWLSVKGGKASKKAGVAPLPSAAHEAGWLTKLVGFGRSANRSWTEDEKTLRGYHARRSMARRVASASRRRNRTRHPQSAKAA